MKKACVAFGTGCPRSYIDACRLVDYLRKNDWQLTDIMRDADILLVGVCGFCQVVEDRSIALLKVAEREKKKESPFVAFGCLAAINTQRLLNEFDILPVWRTTFDDLDPIIDAQLGIRDVAEPNDLAPYASIKTCFTKDHLAAAHQEIKKHGFRAALSQTLRATRFGTLVLDLVKGHGHRPQALDGGPSDYFIRVGYGCTGQCSYCAIRKATGPLQSKPLEKIIKEFETGLSRKYKSYCLIAEDVGAYGQDTGTNICILLEALLRHRGAFVLTIDDFSPKYLIEYFPRLSSAISRNANKFNHLGFPVQSGSEKILQLMKREYSAQDVLDCILRLKMASPDLQIDTHVIIGFPGETESDFKATEDMLKKLSCRRVLVHPYADRPGIKSARLPDHVPEEVIESRISQLKETIPGVLAPKPFKTENNMAVLGAPKACGEISRAS